MDIAEDCTPSPTLTAFCNKIVSENERVHGLLIADFDNDGLPDIFPHGHDKDDEILFAPDFVKKFDNLRTPFDRHDCDGADIDLDGDIDLFCAYGAQGGEGSVGNELRLNLGDGRFTRVDAGDASDPYGRGRKSIFLDINGDLFPDLFIANWGERQDGQSNDSGVYINTKNNDFERDKTIELGTIGGRCAAKIRHNSENPEGLALCLNGGNSRLYLNENGVLKDSTDSLKLKNKRSLSWFAVHSDDLNGDRLDDLITIDQAKNLSVFINTGRQEFTFEKSYPQVSLEPVLNGFLLESVAIKAAEITSIAIFDANMDGQPDIYLGTNISMPDSSEAYLGDFVFFGPKFDKRLWLGPTSKGTYIVKKYGENSLVIVRAGPNDPGSVILMKPLAAK